MSPSAPLLVSILRQGDHLLASINAALDDGEMLRFQEELVERIGRERCRGVIIDVAAHHVTLLEVLPDVRTPAEVLTTSTAASEFLTEVLSAFSMTTHAFASLRQQLQDAHEEVAALRAQLGGPGAGPAPAPDGDPA